MKLRRQKWRSLRRMYFGDIQHPARKAVKAQPTNITEGLMKILSERFGATFIVVKFFFPANKEKRLK